MFSNLKNIVAQNIINISGWHTNRKIVVVESDDWGSIRMPSRATYDKLLAKGIPVDELPYNRYDALESEDDIKSLFEVLSSVKDSRENSAIFTTNTIVANPDFEKIRDSDFQEYFFEPFTETYRKYSYSSNSYEKLKEGIAQKLIVPQFHGREHVNVKRWISALSEDKGNVRLAFENQMFDLSTSYLASENSFMGTFNFDNMSELSVQKQAIIEGTTLFENLFGFKSASFIAPCYIWSNSINETLQDCGINTIQGNYLQLEPTGTARKFKKRLHFTGQRNEYAQTYLVRNVSFEPSENESFDWIGSALKQISNSLLWNKPAIISSHRMNYIGSIDPTNRSRNLKLLNILLNKIIQKWPEVEFMSSDELGKLIQKKQ